MKALINYEAVKKYRPLSKELGQDRISLYVIEAQMNDLRPVLGDGLFWDFLAKFDQTGDVMYTNYQELLNGKTYIPTGAVAQVVYEGIEPMLSYFALARFFENNPIHATRYGIVQKNNDQSEPVSPQVLAKAVDSLRSMALAYQKPVKDFLINFVSVFPLYQYVDNTKIINSTGVKFFDV